jgi:hypothetical protein
MSKEFALYLVPKGAEYYEHDGSPTTYHCSTNTVDINHFKKVAQADFVVQVTESEVMTYDSRTGYSEYMGKAIAEWGGGQGTESRRCIIAALVLQPYTLKWQDGSEVQPTDYFTVAKDTEIEVPGEDRWGDHLADKNARKHTGCITTDEQIRAVWRYGSGADGKGPGLYFYWGDGKLVRFENTTKAETPAPKVAKAKVPTVRDYMVPKSKWELNASIDIYGVRRKQNSYDYERYLYTTLHAGDVITIRSKFSRLSNGKGFTVPIKLADGFEAYLPFDDLKDIVTQVGEVDVIPEYVIFDTAELKYYRGTDYHYDENHQRNDTLLYTDKLSKARKYKRLGDVRAHVLVQSGYYDGLPGEENLPDWMRGGKCFDVPDTWEIHEINKLTKLVTRKIELINTFKRTWRLRALTLQYGSAVRAVFSDLEKKNKLDDFSAVLVFAKKKSNNQYYDDFELTAAEREEITEAISNVDKKDIKSGKAYGAHAFGIKDSSTGIMIKLTYSGELDCKVIDLKLMAEVADQQESVNEQ